jgi:hypothetical protein
MHNDAVLIPTKSPQGFLASGYPPFFLPHDTPGKTHRYVLLLGHQAIVGNIQAIVQLLDHCQRQAALFI